MTRLFIAKRNGLSIQKQRHQQPPFSQNCCTRALGLCSLICHQRKREKARANTCSKLDICCGNSILGARKEGTPTRDKKKRPQRRLRYHHLILPYFTFLFAFVFSYRCFRKNLEEEAAPPRRRRKLRPPSLCTVVRSLPRRVPLLLLMMLLSSASFGWRGRLLKEKEMKLDLIMFTKIQMKFSSVN